MKLRALLLLSSCSLITGCASTLHHTAVPAPIKYPPKPQPIMQASQHWDILAKDISDQAISAICRDAGKKQDQNCTPKNITLKVSPKGGTSPFSKALNGFLITRLVNDGNLTVPTDSTYPSEYQISYETQIVRFDSDRPPSLKNSFTSESSMVTFGSLAILRNAIVTPWAWSGAVKAGLALTGANDAYDVYNSRFHDGPPPNTELIVTTSITKSSRENNKEVVGYVSRRSDIYYFHEADSSLFVENSARKLKVRACEAGKEC